MQIAKALVEPLMLLRQTESGRTFAKLLAREVHDPVESNRGIMEEYFDPIAEVTIGLLRRAVPDVPEDRVYWAYVFAVGTLSTNLAGTGRVERLSGGLCHVDQPDTVERLDNYIAGGLLGVLCPEILLKV